MFTKISHSPPHPTSLFTGKREPYSSFSRASLARSMKWSVWSAKSDKVKVHLMIAVSWTVPRRKYWITKELIEKLVDCCQIGRVLRIRNKGSPLFNVWNVTRNPLNDKRSWWSTLGNVQYNLAKRKRKNSSLYILQMFPASSCSASLHREVRCVTIQIPQHLLRSITKFVS